VFPGGFGQGLGGCVVFYFGHCAALAADEELHVVVVVVGFHAGDEGV
jgi:hypothetical protein